MKQTEGLEREGETPGRALERRLLLWGVCVCVWAEEEYLHSQAVVRHRHTGVSVPAHVHGCVGTVMCLLVQ